MNKRTIIVKGAKLILTSNCKMAIVYIKNEQKEVILVEDFPVLIRLMTKTLKILEEENEKQ